MLEQTGLKSGTDFFLGFSPEREDPGNATHNTRTIPKVVSGDGKTAQQLVAKLYGAFIAEVVPVSSNDTAEAVKLTENIFRSVNIALVNELKVIYSALGIDIWEVIDAAKTKPFGYMPFYPGPGLGGHCIPIDPFYLSWKAEQIGLKTRFIELAGEINISMPQYVIDKLAAALSTSHDKLLKGSNVIVIGLAYKKNISDIRESPSFALIELLQEKGVNVEFHDPFVDEIPPTREHAALAGRKSVALTRENIKATDAIVISTDHDNIDYQMLAENAALVIDSRNIMENNGLTGNNIIKA
jgi:UDP-N-acetyl-D-glucosamine dehydrogenase